MFTDAETLADKTTLNADVTVIGAGAAGIVIALELAGAGLKVNLIESGNPAFSDRIQKLSDAADLGPIHPPINECSRRQVGGTSVIWGGRIVPFDPIDFDDRPYMPDSRWPIAFEQIKPFYDKASLYARAGKPLFNTRELPNVTQTSLVPELPDGDVVSSSLERWSVINYGAEYEQQLRASDKINVVHGLTCTEIETAETDVGKRRVVCIHAKTVSGRALRLESKRFILACGGLNVARLLLNSDRTCPGGVGNHSGLVGKFYSGHISGRIAQVRFSTPPKATVFGFDRDEAGVYARRRLSFSRECQQREQLPNIVSWLVNADISDPAHGNGVLSFAYLALKSPMGKFFASDAIRKAAIKGAVQGSNTAHALNMLRDIPRTAFFIPTFGYKRFIAKRKVPGFFQYSPTNVYMLHYFGEQVPREDSCATLADERDELGMRRLKISYRYSDADVENVQKAHRIWDEYLRKHNVGRLEYVEPDVPAAIRAHAGDGYHQVGLTRMSDDPARGVVDANCVVHGFDDLSIASSSTFVTASQANSMFMILVLALRIADRVAMEAR